MPFIVRYDGATWDQAQPFQVRLAGGSAAPEWDAALRVLTVHLPPAAIVTVRVASLFGGDLSLMGLLEWCERSLTPIELDRVVGR